MSDDKRSKPDNTPEPGLGRDKTIANISGQDDISGEENSLDNPQEESDWNNYQTRELTVKSSDKEHPSSKDSK